MKKNPFLKAEDRLIRKIYGNTVTLTYKVKTRSYNSNTGELSETVLDFIRAIHISSPGEFADTLIDGENIKRGDLSCEVPRLELIDALSPMDGDPGTLADFRSGTLMCSGIDIATDRIAFGGREYSIRKINPKNIYANEPSRYKLHLREVN